MGKTSTVSEVWENWLLTSACPASAEGGHPAALFNHPNLQANRKKFPPHRPCVLLGKVRGLMGKLQDRRGPARPGHSCIHAMRSSCSGDRAFPRETRILGGKTNRSQLSSLRGLMTRLAVTLHFWLCIFSLANNHGFCYNMPREEEAHLAVELLCARAQGKGMQRPPSSPSRGGHSCFVIQRWDCRGAWPLSLSPSVPPHLGSSVMPCTSIPFQMSDCFTVPCG